MIYLVGGPVRTGKSTLADRLLARAGIPYCRTDNLVGMLQVAAPQLGVRHGPHSDKADSMADLLAEFVRCAALSNAKYLIEGDVVTPAFATAMGARLKAVRAVFLGNTALTLAALKIAPLWLMGMSDDELEGIRHFVIARSEAVRAACQIEQQPYVDMGNGWEAGLQEAERLLLQP